MIFAVFQFMIIHIALTHCYKLERLGIDFLGGLNFKVKNFPLLNPQKHEFSDPFLVGLKIFGQNAL